MPKVQYGAPEKFAILQEVESGQLGLMATVKNYGINKSTLAKWRGRYEVIASRTQLSNLVKKYNGHSSLKTYTGGVKAMTKGRFTTWQERIDIVLYCLTHHHDYQKTAEQYQVSYQQVYQWVKKYENGGQDALQDGQGRKKALEELTEADRQKFAMKKLEYENERLRAENAFLKKLQEIERWRR
ncbi:helix-turn-helix domain-containing protein [Brevibacterium sp. JNUCC-42]|nr:helix-turn-helix domain-containing protein [Brevibacterium sp. JNUCC-42]